MIKLAIDLGSSVTKIFKLGSGIVLAEPTCVAVASGTSTVKAIGEDAKRLIGKTAEYTTIVFPVFEADIVNEEMAAVMLTYFLKRSGSENRRQSVRRCFLMYLAGRRTNCSINITALRMRADLRQYILWKHRFYQRSDRI